MFYSCDDVFSIINKMNKKANRCLPKQLVFGLPFIVLDFRFQNAEVHKRFSYVIFFRPGSYFLRPVTAQLPRRSAWPKTRRTPRFFICHNYCLNLSRQRDVTGSLRSAEYKSYATRDYKQTSYTAELGGFYACSVRHTIFYVKVLMPENMFTVCSNFRFL